jgi:tetratricopeptide (TPR) repeat protein
MTLDDDGQHDAAEEEYRQVLDFQTAMGRDADTSTALTRYYLSGILQQRQQVAEAIDHLRVASQIYQAAGPPNSPTSVRVWRSLAKVLDDNGQSEEAEHEYRQLLGAQTAANADAGQIALTRRLLAQTLHRREEHAEAIDQLRTALRTYQTIGAEADSVETWRSLAKALDESGHHEEAEGEYTECISRYPDPAESTLKTAVALAHLEFIMTLHERGRHEAAMTVALDSTAYALAALGEFDRETIMIRRFLIHEAGHCGATAVAASEARALIESLADRRALVAGINENLDVPLQLATELHGLGEYEEAARAAEAAAEALQYAYGSDDDRTKKAIEYARHNREHPERADQASVPAGEGGTEAVEAGGEHPGATVTQADDLLTRREFNLGTFATDTFVPSVRPNKVKELITLLRGGPIPRATARASFGDKWTAATIRDAQSLNLVETADDELRLTAQGRALAREPDITDRTVAVHALSKPNVKALLETASQRPLLVEDQKGVLIRFGSANWTPQTWSWRLGILSAWVVATGQAKGGRAGLRAV